MTFGTLHGQAEEFLADSARQRGLNAMVIPSKGKPREEHDREVVAALKQQHVDLVCLAGYMRLLSPWFVQQFPHRILNIHPSLLPAFPGLEAQEQASRGPAIGAETI